MTTIPVWHRPADATTDRRDSSPRRIVSGFIRFLLLLAILPAAPLGAQSNVDGAISGSARAAGSGAVVDVENIETGYRRTATIGTDGKFRISALPPGSYRVTVQQGTEAPLVRAAEVKVGGTSAVDFNGTDVLNLERYVVSALSVNPVDFSNTESTTVFSEKLIHIMPIAQNVNAVALLAPGTTLGDASFNTNNPLGQSYVSFGGSSVAENSFFVNGFNVSNFRNGLEPSNIPFEFYNQFEVKTGAYSAEFGRSTGGVVNATTKYGTNEYKAGVSIYWTPAGTREHHDDILYQDSSGLPQVHLYTSEDRRSDRTMNFHASGPLWKDKLFFYALYTLNDSSLDNYYETRLERAKEDSPFWGLKLDFYPFRGHHLEYTGFSDKSVVTNASFDHNYATKATDLSAPTSIVNTRFGGRNDILRYTASFGDNFNLSLLYGRNRADRTSSSSVDDQYGIWDTRAGSGNPWVSGNPDLQVASGYDERESMRIDADFSFSLLGEHRIRAGMDYEDNLSAENTVYSGGHYYRYYTVTPGQALAGGVVPAGVTEVVRDRIYTNGGSFGVKSNAFYVEDTWRLRDDRLMLRLGLRSETFDNRNSLGKSFIRITNQLAPRLGLSYDLTGDRKTKLFANYGRYHLPIATNTNIRLAGAELFTQDYYVLEGVQANYYPQIGAHIGEQTVYSDGTIKDPLRIIDRNISPMYQDEYVIGVQRAINANWSAGVRGIYRNLATSIDDVITNQALASYAQRNNITNYHEPDANEYVLTNPGQPLTYYYDIDGDGTDDRLELTAADLGFPQATRKYYAVELFVERLWDKRWNAQFSYTWSHSYGNSEGLVKSDNGQTDAGITANFDAVGLAIGSSGDLPNDRRHQFKLFGSYAISPELTMGLNMRLTSGRPLNAFGVYDAGDDPVATGYGNIAFAYGGTIHSRGTAGRSPWVLNADLSLSYTPKALGDKVKFGVDLFNILNRSGATEVWEYRQDATGSLDYRYQLPEARQAARFLRFSAQYNY